MYVNVNHICFFLQGTGRYAIYIANYASGNVGPHALIEMDEAASDLSQGVVALSNVAEQAGVNKFTGRYEEMIVCVCDVDPRPAILDLQSDLHRHLQRSMCLLSPYSLKYRTSVQRGC